jgi:hypothetical protein
VPNAAPHRALRDAPRIASNTHRAPPQNYEYLIYSSLKIRRKTAKNTQMAEKEKLKTTIGEA